MKLKANIIAIMLTVLSVTGWSQGPMRQIYETERAFEKAAAEYGVPAAFREFMAEDGIMFVPDATNARQFFAGRPRPATYLTWNPEIIDVSENGVLGYSIGNSIARQMGKDDPNGVNGHYLTIWRRESEGRYRAILDAGIHHQNPALINTAWHTPAKDADANSTRLSAADSSTRFFEMAAEDMGKAYGKFVADDAVALREGLEPGVGRKQFRDLVSKTKGSVKFSKRKSFLEAGDLSYVHGPYSIVDKSGKDIEKGNFVQVWKFRKGSWQIVADVLSPAPSK